MLYRPDRERASKWEPLLGRFIRWFIHFAFLLYAMQPFKWIMQWQLIYVDDVFNVHAHIHLCVNPILCDSNYIIASAAAVSICCRHRRCHCYCCFCQQHCTTLNGTVSLSRLLFFTCSLSNQNIFPLWMRIFISFFCTIQPQIFWFESTSLNLLELW